MKSFVQLHRIVFERSPSLKSRLDSWIAGEVKWLTPVEWFTGVHDIDDATDGEINSEGWKLLGVKLGQIVWAPTPVAAETAIEDLR